MKKLLLILMTAALATVMSSCAKDHDPISAGSGTTGSVSGQVVDISGNGVSGVKITIGDATGTTDDSGNFVVEKVLSGTVTVTPSKSGFYIVPPTQDVTLSGSSAVVKYEFVSNTKPFNDKRPDMFTWGGCLNCHSKGIFEK